QLRELLLRRPPPQADVHVDAEVLVPGGMGWILQPDGEGKELGIGERPLVIACISNATRQGDQKECACKDRIFHGLDPFQEASKLEMLVLDLIRGTPAAWSVRRGGECSRADAHRPRPSAWAPGRFFLVVSSRNPTPVGASQVGLKGRRVQDSRH